MFKMTPVECRSASDYQFRLDWDAHIKWRENLKVENPVKYKNYMISRMRAYKHIILVIALAVKAGHSEVFIGLLEFGKEDEPIDKFILQDFKSRGFKVSKIPWANIHFHGFIHISWE